MESLWRKEVLSFEGFVDTCRNLPLVNIFFIYPVNKHRDNDCTQRCDLDSDSPALSHRIAPVNLATIGPE